MRPYNSVSSLLLNTVLTGAALIAVAGCSLPSPQKRDLDQEGSTFFIDSVVPSFTETKTAGTFKLPSARTLSVKACLKTNSQSKSILHHSFSIQGEDFQTQELITDTRGCLTWSENLEFNSLAKPQILTVERRILSRGIEKGSRTTIFYINPWSEKVYSQKDSTVRAAAPANQTKKLLKGEGSHQRALWFENVNATLEEREFKNEGILFNLEVRGTPMIETDNDEEQVVLRPLSFGKFKVTATLFYWDLDDAKQKRHLITKTEPLLVEGLINGNLNVQTQFTRTRLCSNGKVSLGIHIEPIDAPPGMTGFQGVYSVGDCDGAKGNLWMRPRTEFFDKYKTDRTYSVTSFIQENPGTTENSNSNTTGAKIEVRKLSFQTVSFDEPRGTLRRKNLNIQACLRSGLDRRGIRWNKFEITKLNGESVTVKSDDEGCLNWDDSVSFDLTGQECWLSKSVRIQNKPFGVNESIGVHYNPWSQDGAFRDARFIAKDSTELKCATGKSSLIVTRYDFDKLNFSYAIDDLLNLEVRKHGPLKISLRMRRPSLSDPSGFVEESAPPGWYLVRWAVVDSFATNYDNLKDQVYSVHEAILPVNGNSVIQEDVTLATKNIRAMGNTNQFLIEVLPLKPDAMTELKKNPNLKKSSLVDASSNLQIATYRAPLMMANNMEGGNFIKLSTAAQGSQLESIIQKYHVEEAAKQKALKDQATPQSFAKSQGLIHVPLTTPAQTQGLTAALTEPLIFKDINIKPSARRTFQLSDLKEIINQGFTEKASNALCSYWFGDFWQRSIPGYQHGIGANSQLSQAQNNLVTMECSRRVRQNPHLVFDLEKKIFPKNPKLSSQKAKGFFRDYSVSHSWGISRSLSDTFTKSWAWDVSAGIKLPEIPGLSFFSASTGVRYGVSKTNSDSVSKGTGTNYNSGITLTVETLETEIVAEDYEQCAVLRLNPNIFITQTNSTLFGLIDTKGHNPFVMAFHPRLKAQERAHFAKSGLLICDGTTRGERFSSKETYYVLNQKMPNGQALDTTSEDSRPFYINLRGEQDLVRFLSFLHNSAEAPTSFEPEFHHSLLLKEPATSAFLRGSPVEPGIMSRSYLSRK